MEEAVIVTSQCRDISKAISHSMGCSVGRFLGYRSDMCSRRSSSTGERDEVDARTRLERKLYLARESPEPVFDLAGCALRHVPAGVYSVCRVLRKESLLLDDNCLTDFHGGGTLGDLFLLTTLGLSTNRFSKIDSDIRLLVNLRVLNLSNNKLSRLTESIGELANLQELDLSQNSLKELPKTVGRLKSLRTLKLKDNPCLTSLCPELCGAHNLLTLALDVEVLTFPPTEVTAGGTASIMMFLCERHGAPYVPPSPLTPTTSSPTLSTDYLERAFHKELAVSWEEREAAGARQESALHAAAAVQREKFLSEIVKEQSELDAEISKIQVQKERERQNLIEEIQEDERAVTEVVEHFLRSTEQQPEILQQQLEHEQAEHDRLLDMCRENYRNVQRGEVLRAMESLLHEECIFQSSMRSYEDSLGDVKRSMLLQELESSEKLEQVFKLKDQTHSTLVEQLLQDQDVQKAAVASLLERVDARSWSLNQEISIVASNLAKLSAIEQDKQRLKVNFNYNQLLEQRVQLLDLLDDLLEQQNKRRGQLIQTLKDIELQTDHTSDFWLANYQRLMDSAPKTILDAGRTLDPLFANYLLQEGVIHCLPFLVKFIFSTRSLAEVSTEQLMKNGVNLTSDREGILRAIKYYIDGKLKEKSEGLHKGTVSEATPSAPIEPESAMESNLVDKCFTVFSEFSGTVCSSSEEPKISSSECVVCMDAHCEVLFVPCGHLCCCLPCSEKEITACPMCRVTIEKKIKVIIP